MITHPELVAALIKPGQAILETLTPEKCHIWHMELGITTEAGELGDAIKNHIAYNKPLDATVKGKNGEPSTIRDNILEEFGDIEFYLEGLRVALGITREQTLTHNIGKLQKRYESKTGKLVYSDAAAEARRDKTVPALDFQAEYIPLSGSDLEEAEAEEAKLLS